MMKISFYFVFLILIIVGLSWSAPIGIELAVEKQTVNSATIVLPIKKEKLIKAVNKLIRKGFLEESTNGTYNYDDVHNAWKRYKQDKYNYDDFISSMFNNLFNNTTGSTSGCEIQLFGGTVSCNTMG
jgi:hypothetical protein